MTLWWEQFYLDPTEHIGLGRYVDHHGSQWLSTGLYYYEGETQERPQCRLHGDSSVLYAGKYRWHNELVDRLNDDKGYNTVTEAADAMENNTCPEPTQHEVARAWANTTLARQCDKDPETGLSKIATGFLLLAAYIELKLHLGIRVPAKASYLYLAVPQLAMVGPAGQIWQRSIRVHVTRAHNWLLRQRKLCQSCGNGPKSTFVGRDFTYR